MASIKHAQKCFHIVTVVLCIAEQY